MAIEELRAILAKSKAKKPMDSMTSDDVGAEMDDEPEMDEEEGSDKDSETFVRAAKAVQSAVKSSPEVFAKALKLAIKACGDEEEDY